MIPSRGSFGLLVLFLIGWNHASAFAEVALQVTASEESESKDLHFGTVRSQGPQGEEVSEVVVRRVKLTITSDSSGRYQVFQRVNAPPANSNGTEFPLKAARFFISEASGRGDVRVPNPTPLDLGEEEIYLSDSTGSSTELVVNVTLQVPRGQQAGQYQSSISYRVIQQS